ncbi:MAG: NADH-quinone oxidoreductase subunit H, partial [Planctomycetaceae bacterium]|nr:NADH-quinone oxidoreductase subunit H [Planctomycetaceae bacterium]
MNGLFAATSISEFLSGLKLPFAGSLSPLWVLLIAALIHAVILINIFAILPLFYIWLERKVAGRIQDRLGPTRVGGKFGWLQTLADGIKLIQKEDLAPGAADRWIFRIAPYLAVIASFAAF